MLTPITFDDIMNSLNSKREFFMGNNIKNKQRSAWYFTAWMEYLCAGLESVEINVTESNLMGKKYGKEYAP